MERKTLLYQPSGQSDKRAYTQVNAPAGAFGDAGGAMAGFGRDVQSLGGSLAQVGQNRARIAEELKRREEADTQAGLDAATRKARQFTQEERAAQDNDPNFVQPDDQVKHISDMYQRNLADAAKEFKVDPKLIETPKFNQYKEREYAVRDDGLKRQDLQLAGLRYDKVKTVNDSVLSEMSGPDGTPNGTIDDNLTRMEGMTRSTVGYPGLSDTRKTMLLSDMRNKSALIIGRYANSMTEEERMSAQTRLVSIGFTDNDAKAITKATPLAVTDVKRIAEQGINLMSQGNVEGANKAFASIKNSVTPEHMAEISAKATLAGGIHVFTQAVHSEDLTLPQSQSLLQEIDSDTTGYAYISKFLSNDDLRHFSVPDLQAEQAKLRPMLVGRNEVLKSNPAQYIDDLPSMKPVVDSMNSATTKFMNAVLSGDQVSLNNASAEFRKSQKDYSTMSAIRRSGLSVAGGDSVTPAVPNAAVNSLANNLLNHPSSERSASVLMTLSKSGPEGAQFSEAVARNLAGRAGNTSANKMGAAILVQLAALNANGPLDDEFNKNIAANAFDEVKAKKTELALSMAEPVDLRDGGKTMTLSKHLDNLIRTVGISHGVDTVDKVFKQEQASSDLSQTPARFIEGFANTHGVSLEAASGMVRTTILNSAGQDGSGVVTQASIEKAVGDFASAAAASGMITVKNASTGQRELAYYPLKDSKIQGFFSPAEAGKVNNVATLAEARQAVANFFPSEAKLTTADRHGPKTSNPVEGLKPWYSGKAGPFDLLSASFEQSINNWTRWNATFFGNDLGSPDISPAYLNREVMSKFGFLPEAFAKEGGTFKMGDGQELTYTEYVSRVHQTANPDGSVSISWKAGTSRAFDSRVNTGNSATGKEILRVPANMVRAATDYVAMQGTSADGSDTYTKAANELSDRVSRNIDFTAFNTNPGQQFVKARSKASVPATDAQIARDHQLSLVDRLLFLHKTK